MDVFESIGLIQYWGLSPAINLVDKKYEKKELNVLLTGTSDLRHILKTCADICDNPEYEQLQINFYIHEKQKEITARNILFMLILHCSSLNYRERMELFFDIYGNSCIREKSQQFIDQYMEQMVWLVSDIQKHSTPMKELFDLSELKYKEIDELVEIFYSWSSKTPFNIEKYRDDRLRYHYKTRYDYRLNLIDWDYQMVVKVDAPVIHWVHYRDWRQNGVAFEQRFSTYIVPNRTLSSWIPGKKKVTRDSCLVKGFWGDILISPYIGFGVETDYEPEKQLLFKIVNTQQVSHSVAVSEFHLQYYLQKLDTFDEFIADLPEHYSDRPDVLEQFTHRKIQKYLSRQKQKQQKIETNQSQMKEQENEDEDETQDKQMKAQMKQNQQEQQKLMEDQKQEIEQKIQENENQDPKIKNNKEYVIGDILKGLKNPRVKIIPIFEEIEKMSSKKKFQGFFDIGVFGFIHSGFFQQKDLHNLFNERAVVFAERSKFVFALKQEERNALDQKLLELTRTNIGKQMKTYDKQHHFRFEDPLKQIETDIVE